MTQEMRRDLAELIDRRKPKIPLIEYLPDDDTHSAEKWLDSQVQVALICLL